MVSRRSDESGRIKIGCLLSLVLFIALIYLTIDYAGVRIKAYQMQDAVSEQASFASVIDDVTIRNRLVSTADRLGIPLGPRQWTIRRQRIPSGSGRQISITATYTDSMVIAIPGFRKVLKFTFTPSADETY